MIIDVSRPPKKPEGNCAQIGKDKKVRHGYYFTKKLSQFSNKVPFFEIY